MHWSPAQESTRLMADPSLLLSQAGERMLEEGSPNLVVSQSFLDILRVDGEIDFDFFQVFRADDDDTDPSSYVERIREITHDVPGFSYQTALEENLLDEESRRVLDRILESDDPLAAIDADQWAFLNSHSWLGSQSRRALDVFRRARAVVIEASRDIGIKLLDEVIPMDGRPDGVDAALIRRGMVKWLVVGGAGIGGGTLGGLLGAALAGPIGTLVGEQVIEHLAEAAAKRVVVALDP